MKKSCRSIVKPANTDCSTAGAEYARKFDLLASSSSILTIVIDPQFRITYCNDDFVRQYGITKSKIMGRRCFEIVHCTNKPVAGCPHSKSISSRKRESCIAQVGAKWFDIVVEPVFDAGGKLKESIHLMKDITLNKSIHDTLDYIHRTALNDTGEEFLVSMAKFISWITGAERVIIGEILPGTNDVAKTQVILHDGKLLKNINCSILSSPCGDLFKSKMKYYRHKAGKMFPDAKCLKGMRAECFISMPLIGSFGKAVGTIAVANSTPFNDLEVTKAVVQIATPRIAHELEEMQKNRELAESIQTIEQSRSMLEMVTESIPAMIAYTDSKMVFKYANRRYCEWFGLETDEVVGKTVKTVLGSVTYRQVAQHVKAALHGSTVSFEVKQMLEGKTIKIKNTTLKPRMDELDEVSGLYIFSMDLTEKKKSEKQLILQSTMLDNAKDSIMLIDYSGKIIFANKAAYETRGYTRDQFLSIPLNRLDTPEHARQIKARMGELREKGHIFFESEHYRSDGSVIPVEVNVVPLAIDNTEYVLAVDRDITERKENVRKLKEAFDAILNQEKRFSYLYEAAKAVLHFEDFPAAAQNIFHSCKKFIGAASGYVTLLDTASGLNQVVYLDSGGLPCTVDPNIPMPIRGLRKTAYDTGAPSINNGFNDSELKGCLPDGHMMVKNLMFVPMKLADKTVGLIGLANKPEGFTEDDGKMAMAFAELAAIALSRSKASELLKASEERFKDLFQQAPVGYHSLDEKGRILDVNETWLAMLGYSRDEMIGKPFDYFMPKATKEIFNDMFDGHAICDKVSGAELEVVRKDGSIIAVSLFGKIVTDEKQKILSTRCVFYDITKTKVLEAERERLRSHLAQLQKEEAIGSLAGGIAHDFNNQLAIMLGYAEEISSRSTDGFITQSADNILTSGYRAADLTAQLLAFARKSKEKNEPVDVHSLIREVVKLLSRSIDKKIKLKLMLDAKTSLVLGDQNQLQNVFLNITLNARDAMPDGGSISFETVTAMMDNDDEAVKKARINAGEYLLVLIRDTGVGMSEETKKRMFEPFYTTKSKDKGLGMGMPASLGIVRDHNGTIEFSSEEGKGTTFTVYLPLSDEIDIAREKSAPARKVKSTARSARILVVDDEKMLRVFLKQTLEKNGHNVVTCENGKKAVKYLASNPDEVDLVILDMIMPEMGGKEALPELIKLNPAVKVILTTGFTKEPFDSKNYSRNVTGLLKKPFLISDIYDMVATALSKA